MPHSPRECEPQPVRAAAPGPRSPSPKRPRSPGARPHRPPASRRGCVKGILRVLYRVELPLSLVQVKLHVVKLVLQEVDRCVMIQHRVLKLVNLAVSWLIREALLSSSALAS